MIPVSGFPHLARSLAFPTRGRSLPGVMITPTAVAEEGAPSASELEPDIVPPQLTWVGTFKIAADERAYTHDGLTS